MKAASISTKELLDSNALARGLAIWIVVACHVPFAHAFWKPLWVFASAGKLAVSIFLFSSGLLLQYQVNRAGGKLVLATWLKKRFVRIYPVYWAGLMLTLFCAAEFRGRTYGAGVLLANVLGIPLLLGKKIVSCGYSEPFWFISLLLLCYVLFLFTYRIRGKGVLVLIALAMSFIALGAGHFMEAAVLAFPSFFTGMWMADRLMRRGEVPSHARRQVAMFFPLLAILALVYKGRALLRVDERYSIWFDLLGCACLTAIPIPSLYMVAILQKWLAKNGPRVLRAALWISSLTFGVYCIHEPFLLVLARLTGAGHPWAGMIGYVLVTLFAAWILEVLMKPLTRARRAT